ncbi:MAG: hypothetical protein K2J82_09270 [Muribaculaceae bacterium]|nr:hypothetical protein [Muribaculaceae bacterium]
MSMRVKPTDLISGAFYLKLVNDYQEYDKKQKKIIEKQQEQIKEFEEMMEELQTIMDETAEDSHAKLRTKLKNQRAALSSYLGTIRKLRKENEELLIKNAALTEELNHYRQE